MQVSLPCRVTKSPDRPLRAGVRQARLLPVGDVGGVGLLLLLLVTKLRVGASEAEAVKGLRVAVPRTVLHHGPLRDADPVALVDGRSVPECV